MSTICKNCGADLNEVGYGFVGKYCQVEYPDGSFSDVDLESIAGVDEYYCPSCGKTISDGQYEELTNGWYGKKGVSND